MPADHDPISRRCFLEGSAQIGAASLLAATPAVAAAAADQKLGFFVIGDWGRHGAHHQIAVGRAMAAAAAESDPRFIVSAGDNFYESGVTSIHDPQWRSSFEDVYSEAALQRPWHVILGNHDYRGDVEAQIDYSKLSHRWHLPARYYTRTKTLPDRSDAEIFYLDTSPFIRKYLGTSTRIEGQNPHAQREWLDTALGRSTARWKIVIGHHPIYTTLGGAGHDQPDLIAAIEPLLRRHRVKLYINGHDHTMQYVEMGGIAYVTTGAGSETYTPGPASRTGFVSGAHGFLACAATKDAIGLDFIDSTGRSLFRNTITAA
ncbi:metallophosphoesterase [Acidiphilium iwatense]|uniref:acid phosphatase n=1 Tax=Acidiphilium iwatense TaxID=768198 RepID=A0ABS9E4R7_9PROT|nr:metallophosphoesterase [Acidiphilium iwatense]MCF3948569.1 metallophosphoesterase [Acidiphilium iwatense]